MAAELQTFFNHPKVTATQKLLLPESNGPFGLLNPKVTGAITFRILRYYKIIWQTCKTFRYRSS